MAVVHIRKDLAAKEMTLEMQIVDSNERSQDLPPEVNIMVVFDEHDDKKNVVTLTRGKKHNLGPCINKDLKRDSAQIQAISAATESRVYTVVLVLSADGKSLHTDRVDVDIANAISMRRLSWSYIMETT